MFHWLADILASTTTTVTFFTIFLVGVGFSAFSLIAGGHSDHADHDIGHDADHDIGHDGGADHHGGHDGHGHDGSDDAGLGVHSLFSVGMFSVRGVALLATGFGGIGFLLYATTEKLLFSTASAFVGG